MCYYPRLNNLCVVLILTLCPVSIHSQHLTATYSSAKLPVADYGHRAWYDGLDDIYLFGGSKGFTNSNRILRYSLSKDTISWAGSLPVTARFGSIQSDGNGNIFYFGAGTNDNTVLTFNPITHSSSVVAQLPDIYGIPTIKLDNNTVLILGRYADGLEIVSFDLE